MVRIVIRNLLGILQRRGSGNVRAVEEAEFGTVAEVHVRTAVVVRQRVVDIGNADDGSGAPGRRRSRRALDDLVPRNGTFQREVDIVGQRAGLGEGEETAVDLEMLFNATLQAPETINNLFTAQK